MTPAELTLKRYREDERGILQFVEEQFKASPDPWQEEALLAWSSRKPEHRRISLQACAGPGKTTVLAWAGWWFMAVFGEVGEHPNGACVSITGDNLKNNLWKEYAKWQARSPYLQAFFTWTSTTIFANDHPATWRLSARSWPKRANADEQGTTLSGLHGKYVMAQADESGGIPTSILRAGEQALAQAGGGFGKLFQAGNPLSLDGMLYYAANQLRDQWHVIRITGDPEDPKAWVHATRVGEEPKAWANLQISTYGRENPWVKAYILGQFPPASINALLGVEDVQAAMERHLREDVYEWSQKRIGVDVARFGDDRTVLFPRQGLAAYRPMIMRLQNTVQIAARVAKAHYAWKPELILVDDTGHWGHGVIDNLTTAGYPAVPVVFSDPALSPRFRNRRAEMWMLMAEWVKGGGALPHLDEMMAELTAPTYTLGVNGKLQLEEKDQIKARIGRSPDLGDALALTFALPDQPGAVMRQFQAAHTTLHDGDPYARPREQSANAEPVQGRVTHDFDPFN